MVAKQDVTSEATILTLSSSFVLGCLDVYSYMLLGGTFISAQTGNLVALWIKLVVGKYEAVLKHLPLLIGFFVGCILAEALIVRYQYRINYLQIYHLVQLIFLLLLTIVQLFLSKEWQVFLLSGLAGYLLAVFRTVRRTTLNNGIMTGNLKNLYGLLFSCFIKKQKKWLELGDYFLLLSCFIGGIIAGTLLYGIFPEGQYLFCLWLSIIIYLINILLRKRMENNTGKSDN